MLDLFQTVGSCCLGSSSRVNDLANRFQFLAHFDHLFHSADLTELIEEVHSVHWIEWILVFKLGDHQLQEQLLARRIGCVLRFALAGCGGALGERR